MTSKKQSLKKLWNITTRSFSESYASVARKKLHLQVIKVTPDVYFHPDLAICDKVKIKLQSSYSRNSGVVLVSLLLTLYIFHTLF